jgi:hypothetical protein
MIGQDFSNVQSGSSSTQSTIIPYAMVPYQLSPIERENWLWANGNRLSVKAYLSSGNPQWGIIERAQITPSLSGDFLLFIPILNGIPQTQDLRIVYVEGHSIVEEVQKAPFRSPDDVGFFENLQRQLNDVLSTGQSLAKFALIGLAVFLVLQIVRK